MPKPLVTICTPVYNLEEYVGETLQSIAAQSFTDFEVLIIDDGSTDNSAKAIEPFLSDSRFKYIHQTNSGVGAARNKAIALAEGEWFAQLDGDDIYLPNALQVYADLALPDSRTNFVYANMLVFREDGFEQVAFEDADFRQGDIADWIYTRYGFSTQHVMLKTENLRAIGGYQEHFPALEDYDLYLRYAHNGIWAKSRNEVIARYRVRAQSKTAGLVRNARLSAEMVEAAIAREDRPDLARILRKMLQTHHCRFHYLSARDAVANGRAEAAAEHLWNYLKYRPGHKKVLVAALLCSLASASHTKLGHKRVRRLLEGAYTNPWDTVEQADSGTNS